MGEFGKQIEDHGSGWDPERGTSQGRRGANREWTSGQ